MERVCGRRVVRITLYKVNLAEGQLTMWWPSAFEGDAVVDVATLPDRSTAQKQSTASFAEAYKQAHEMFKQRVKDIKPVELHLNDNDAMDTDDGDGDGDHAAEHKDKDKENELEVVDKN